MLAASISSVLQPAFLHHFGRLMNWALIAVVLLVGRDLVRMDAPLRYAIDRRAAQVVR